MSSQLSTLGNVTRATRSIASEVRVAMHEHNPAWPTRTSWWGKGSSSEHATGRALDFMVGSKAEGDFVANYLWTHRKRLRLIHEIWRQRIISTRVAAGQWRRMGDRGNSTANHYDHIHALFAPGAYRAPGASSGGGSASKPSKPGQLDVDGIWGRNTTKAMQRWVGATPDGIWGPDSKRKLEKKLRAWMIRKNWPKAPIRVDGKISRRDIRVLQKLVGVTADGYWGPQTTRGVQRHLNKINSK